jgi:hypothetical protein
MQLTVHGGELLAAAAHLQVHVLWHVIWWGQCIISTQLQLVKGICGFTEELALVL